MVLPSRAATTMRRMCSVGNTASTGTVKALSFGLLRLIATALALRYGFRVAQLDQPLGWWYVVGVYLLAAGIVFVVAVAVSRVGPHGAANWRDLRVIAGRFLPLKAF